MWKAFAGCLNTNLITTHRELSLIVTNCHTKRFFVSSQRQIVKSALADHKLTFVGVAADMECRGVKACIVCETPAANMNSSLSSVLVLPRALVLRKKINIFRFVDDFCDILMLISNVKHIQATLYRQWGTANWLKYREMIGEEEIVIKSGES